MARWGTIHGLHRENHTEKSRDQFNMDIWQSSIQLFGDQFFQRVKDALQDETCREDCRAHEKLSPCEEGTHAIIFKLYVEADRRGEQESEQ